MSHALPAPRDKGLPALLDRRSPAPPPDGGKADGDGLDDVTRGPRRIGFAVLLVFLLVFAGWGASAPLAGGALAPGRISPEGGVKTIQHLEGGIVRALHVREGDTVTAGSPLLALESVRQRAEVDALLDRRRARLAERARLEAELAGAERIPLPEGLSAEDPADQAVMVAERRLFDKRRHLLSARKRVLSQRIEQLSEQITGYEAQVESATRQLELIAEELQDKAVLLEKGLTPKSDVLRLRRMQAEIFGRRGEFAASIASAEQRIGETELELVALEAELGERLADRAREVRTELVEIEQSLAAKNDVLTRTVVAAPVDGTVTEMRVKTIGGVVLAGEPIMELVPSDDRLIIDARLAPRDIDVVAPGLTAQVHLSAFAGSARPMLFGTVLSIAADTRVHEETGETFYPVRVEVPADELAKAGDDVSLVPGMVADVLIVSEERTMLAYLLEPIADLIRRSLREA